MYEEWSLEGEGGRITLFKSSAEEKISQIHNVAKSYVCHNKIKKVKFSSYITKWFTHRSKLYVKLSLQN